MNKMTNEDILILKYVMKQDDHFSVVSLNSHRNIRCLNIAIFCKFFAK